MSELVKTKSQVLTKEDIIKLYSSVNRDIDYKIDVNSDFAFVNKIIELWFNEQGYDFWDNPYPKVTEMKVTKSKEIEFVYIIK